MQVAQADLYILSPPAVGTRIHCSVSALIGPKMPHEWDKPLGVEWRIWGQELWCIMLYRSGWQSWSLGRFSWVWNQ